MPPSPIHPHPPPSSLSPKPPTSSSPSPSPPDDDHNHQATLPLPLSQSIILTSLPEDASLALAKAEEGNDGVPAKVTIRFQPIASAPRLRQLVFKISSNNRFETVVSFLKKKLDRERGGTAGAAGAGGREGAFPFCYVNSVFAPGLDEGVGGLWRCFKTDEQLIVAYSMTPAFG